ncbi:MAG: hypothetical protein HY579_05935 [Nitrospinae bacterium]|nr:hypothetical protein [Nitrospinota bacterium]
MTKENENSETNSQEPAPSGPEPGIPEDPREPGPPPLELDASTPFLKPQPAPKSSAAKIAFFVLTLTVVALGGTVYLLLQERAKALAEIREKQARFGSQLQEIERKQDLLAQSVKGLETVRQDLRVFKDQTSTRIEALDQELKTALQQMAADRQALPRGTAETTAGSLPESGTASGETAGRPVEEKARDGDVKTPAQPQPRPTDKNKEIQRYLDFVEFMGSKTSELLREGFAKTRDYIADMLK